MIAMDLFIVRHAWAVERGDPQWPDDELRPLTELGKHRFAKFVSKLVERGMKPEAIATSPLLRCAETAAILADMAGGKPAIAELESLRPGSDIDATMRWTLRQADRCRQVAWVGHSPDVDHMTTHIIGGSNGLVRFAKGSIAAIRFDGPLEVGGGELRWLLTAKLLGC